MKLTDELRKEYEHLFATCAVRPEREAAADAVVDRSVANRARYEKVQAELGTPWFLVAAIHSLESGQSFSKHLHNGDPLSARTVHEPPGRPKTGAPPFTWEQSATDALTLRGLQKIRTWDLPTVLFELEGYNGFGYRLHHAQVLSPYLWSFTNHYTQGKFVGDHEFSATAVSAQCGAAAVLVRMQQRKVADLAGGAVHATAVAHPAVTAAHAPSFPGTALARGVSRGSDVCLVQDRLRALGFAIDRVAGCPFGPQTEAAVTAFQRSHALRPSGRVGRDTWAALFA